MESRLGGRRTVERVPSSQGLYKLVQRSLWNHPVSTWATQLLVYMQLDKCTERNVQDAPAVWAQISLSEETLLSRGQKEECSWIKNGWASWAEGIAQHVPRCWDTKGLAGLENWRWPTQLRCSGLGETAQAQPGGPKNRVRDRADRCIKDCAS